MGNECCQQQNVIGEGPQLQAVMRKQHFILVEFPQDDLYLQQKLLHYPKLKSHTVQKHISMDKYYWGQWQQNAPFGQGFLYRPKKYFFDGKFNLKPNGFGKIQLIESGLTYSGQISEGQAEGVGKLTHRDNLYEYDGTWKNSKPVTGTLIIRQMQDKNKKSIIHFNNFPTDLSRIQYSDGKQYEGIIDQNRLMPQGRGTVSYKDGSKYTGQWSQGHFHGQGVYSWRDGSFYEGHYHFGKKQGDGKFRYPSGKIYDGQWREGVQHGRGTIFDQRGDVIKKGVWRNGQYITSEQI